MGSAHWIEKKFDPRDVPVEPAPCRAQCELTWVLRGEFVQAAGETILRERGVSAAGTVLHEVDRRGLISKWFVDEDMVEHIPDGLRKAGLDIEAP